MKVELKNIAYASRMSFETFCFTASVFIDDKKVGTVENSGHGGSHIFTPWSIESILDKHAKTLQKTETFNIGNGRNIEIEYDAELLINDLIINHLNAKRLKQLLSNKILIVKNGKILTTRKMQKEQMQKAIQMTQSIQEVVLNTMPFEKAFELYAKYLKS